MSNSESPQGIAQLARHSVIYAIGDFVAKGISFLMLPVYTRYLVPAQYGILELLDLISYIAGFVIAMGVAQAMSRFYQDCTSDQERDEVVSAAFTAVVGTALLFLLLGFAFVPQISELVFSSSNYARAIQIVFFSLTFNLVGEIPLTLLRLRQQSAGYVCVSVLRTFVTLSFSIWFVVVQEKGVYGVLYANNISSMLFGVLLILWLRSTIKFRFSWLRFKPLLGYGLPLIGSWLGAFILNFADRFILKSYASLDAVGIYSVAYKFGMLPNLFVLMPFLMVWSTRQFELARRDDAADIFRRLLVYLIFLELYIFLLISLPIREVLSLLVAPEYLVAANYVPFLVLSYVLYAVYSFNQFGLLYSKRTSRLSVIVLGVGLANVALNFLLIPPLGVWGATLATLVAMAILAGAVGFVAQRFYPIEYDIKRICHLVVVAALLYCICYAIEGSATYLILILLVKILVAASFPLFLIVSGFFDDGERRKIESMYHSLIAQGRNYLR